MNNKILLGLVILSLIISVANFCYRPTVSLRGTTRAATIVDNTFAVTGATTLASSTVTGGLTSKCNLFFLADGTTKVFTYASTTLGAGNGNYFMVATTTKPAGCP